MRIIWLLWTCVTVLSYKNGRRDQTVLLEPEFERDQRMEVLSASYRFKRQVVSTCINGYENVVNSTMCAVDSPNFIPRSEGVSAADEQLIIDAHNNYRAGVTPTATNMMKAYWDDELAAIAEKWAKQCIVGHENRLQMSRKIPRYGTSPGQNGAFGYSSWTNAVAGWHSEVQYFQYGLDPNVYIGPGGWTKIGHYTQVVKDTVVLIGCGYANCSTGYKQRYFCNYLTGQGNVRKPYVNGTSCEDCPNRCNGKLCDCGTNFCFNGGSLDIDACTCTCRFPWSGTRCLNHPCGGRTCQNFGNLNVDTCECNCQAVYSGPTCETLSCGQTKDPGHCGTQWPESYCRKFSNVPAECPIMCGLCPLSTTPTTTSAPSTKAPPSSTTTAPPPTTTAAALPTTTTAAATTATFPPTTTTASSTRGSPPTTTAAALPTTTTAAATTATTATFPPTTTAASSTRGSPPTTTVVAPPKTTATTASPPTTTVASPTTTPRPTTTVAAQPTTIPRTAPPTTAAGSGLCNGKRCANRGTLDVRTCTCYCPKLYRGDDCSSVDCPKRLDPAYCGNPWPITYCTRYRNVPTTCPIMCGLCPELCNGKKCKNGGKLDVKTCSCACPKLYGGDTCSDVDCPKRLDPAYCGNRWPIRYCTRSRDVLTTCPIMCGLCPELCNGKKCENGGKLIVKTCSCACPRLYQGDTCSDQLCNGKKCKNGGKLDVKTCSCACPKLYGGDTCSDVDCPKRLDPAYCGNRWPIRYCTWYRNVPTTCPIMCGLCPELCNGKKCENGGKLIVKTCSCACPRLYRGDTCSDLTCPRTEPRFCGRKYSAPACRRRKNVRLRCPYTCGICS